MAWRKKRIGLGATIGGRGRGKEDKRGGENKVEKGRGAVLEIGRSVKGRDAMCSSELQSVFFAVAAGEKGGEEG